MTKVFYVLALLCLGFAILDIAGAYPGTNREMEAGILFLLSPVFAVAGFFTSRASTMACPSCGERVKKVANKCKHCGSQLN